MKSKGFYICSLESKDIYSAMNCKETSAEGYKLRNKEGKISLRKFENTLDWSLETIKLQEEWEKEVRRKDFYFFEKGKKYTQAVINVKFSYSYKEYNMVGKNTYVKAGYNFRDCEIKDGVCVKDGVLTAIQTNVEVLEPLPDELLGRCFGFSSGHYYCKKTIPSVMSKSDLRHYLYEHGFNCDGRHYVRYKRSAGSSRVGKCLFIDERIASRMDKWTKCGLKIEENDQVDLAAFESYISLPLSSIIDTLRIPLDSILVVDDYESVFEDEAIVVSEESGKLKAQEKKTSVTNSIFDGEALLDSSMFGKYSDKGMLLLRNRFFKTCAFNTNLQQWFRDNDITEVSQLNGKTLASSIEQIKLVTTPSSIKYLKFGTLEQWLENIDELFSVVKYEKPTHFFEGRLVQCHYQLLNTLQLNEDEVGEVLKPSLDYIGQVRSDPNILRKHINYPFDEEDEEKISPLRSKNEIIFKMLGINNLFAKTKMYKDFKNDLVKGFVRNLKQGHILLSGNYSTLFGNGLELLQHVIGKFDGKSALGAGNIHSKRFSYGKVVLGSRSPHVTFSNIMLAHNVANEDVDKYFNLTNEIVCVNSIGENLLQKLNGADFDSDSIMLTDDELLIKAAKKNYDKFKIPTNLVVAQKTTRYYNNEHKTDLDVKTSVNKIGEIINLSQQLNSLYWEWSCESKNKETLDELFCDICKLAVLSNIEIDRAKKEFVINSGYELCALKTKYKLEDNGKQVKPMFFKTITTENGYLLSSNTAYKYYNTSMDYLQKHIAKVNFRQAREYKENLIPFMDIVKTPQVLGSSGYYRIQRDKIIDTIRKSKEEIKKLYVDYDIKTKEEKELVRTQAAELKQACINEIDKMSECEATMYLILKELESKECSDVSRFVFEVLFGKPNEAFFTMIRNSKEPLYRLEEAEDGDIVLYGFKYKKVLASA